LNLVDLAGSERQSKTGATVRFIAITLVPLDKCLCEAGDVCVLLWPVIVLDLCVWLWTSIHVMIRNLGSWLIILCVWGLHRGVIEDFILLVCDAESSGPRRIDAVLLGPFDPWEWRRYVHTKCQGLLARWCSITSQKTRVLDVAVCPVKVQFCLVMWGCVNCERSPISLWFEVLSAVLLKSEAFSVVMLCWVYSS
jgi:hypothetical protein